MDEWTRLALAARHDDDGAMDDFVRATHDHVWRLSAYLGDRHRADDLTQETYLRVLRSLHGFRGESPVRPWLFSIVRRVVADDLTARQRRRRHELADPEPEPAAAPDHQETVALVDLLGVLDPDRRTAFVLTQLLGYSYADAAETCGVPVGTIRSRVARARAVLIAVVQPDPRRLRHDGSA